MDPVGHGVEEKHQELPSRLSVRLLDQLRHRELTASVNGNKEIELALGCPKLGDVDVKEPDRVAFEPLLLRLVAIHLRQA